MYLSCFFLTHIIHNSLRLAYYYVSVILIVNIQKVKRLKLRNPCNTRNKVDIKQTLGEGSHIFVKENTF